jgi:hypothetical protein
MVSAALKAVPGLAHAQTARHSDTVDAAGSLLDDMGELVRERPLALRARRSLSVCDHDMVANGVGVRVDGAGGRLGQRTRVHLHL